MLNEFLLCVLANQQQLFLFQLVVAEERSGTVAEAVIWEGTQAAESPEPDLQCALYRSTPPGATCKAANKPPTTNQ